jgi:hypothetical protein
MSNISVDEDIVSRLASQADAVARLAQDSGGFAAVAAAFEAKDAQAFSWVLQRLELLPYCELICEWVRIKFGVLRCTDICGPLKEDAPLPSLQHFAKAVVELSSNEKLLRRVVDAVSCGDRDAYQAAVDELKLNDYCYLLCHWVYSIISSGACQVLCSPGSVYVPDAASEVRAAGEAIGKLLADKKGLDTIANAAVAVNCEMLQSSLTAAGIVEQCEIVCRWICSWRYVWVCREVCEFRPPVVAATGVNEARSFALALGPLVSQSRALHDLVTAARNRDSDAYTALVARFGLEEYCQQVCAWVSSVTCYRLCTCVCPPAGQVIPLFTNVGCYLVGPPISDFNANGTTISGSLAFTGTIPLIGDIPDGTAPEALEYRFTYQDYSGISPNPNPVVPITGLMVPATQIGTLQFMYWNGTFWVPGSVPFWVNNPGATATIPQHGAPALSVPVNTFTDPSGWIQIPRLNDDSPGATGLFTIGGAQGLILLDTTQLTTEVFDLTGASALPDVTAGETMPPQALSRKPVFQINFEAQTVATSTPVSANSLSAIALSNTTYKYVRHPEWPGPTALVIGVGNGTTMSFTGTLTSPVSPGSVQVAAGSVTGKDNGAGAITGAGIASGTINYATGAISVTYSTAPATGVEVQVDYPVATTQPWFLSVDILELDTGGGCTRLDDVIHVLYTAYHPYLGSCTVYLQGPDVATMTAPPGGSISLPIQQNQGLVIGTGNGTTVTFTGTLVTPILPGSVLINAAAVTGTDNTSGAITGAGISGTINYASGVISVTFTSAPASGVQVLVDYNTNDSSGAAGQPFDMTDLPPCGYILFLQATLNLTSGLACCGPIGNPSPDYIPFCTVAGR